MRSLRRWKALVCLVAAVGFIMATPAMVMAAGQRTSQTGIEPVDGVPAVAGADTAGQDLGFPVHHLYPRSNYAWPYATGPSYGKVDVGLRLEPGVLVTQVGTFRLGSELPIPAELRTTAKAARTAFQFYVVQLDPTQIDAQTRQAVIDQVAASGGNVQRNLPVSAFIAKLTPQGLDAVLSAPGVMAVEPYHPAFKLHPSIGRTPLPDSRQATSDVYALDVLVFQGEDANLVAEAIRSLGGEVSSVMGDTVRGSLHRSRLADLARLETVFQVFEYIAPQVQGQETTNAIQTGAINFNTNPYHEAGVLGTGQVLMVLDNGISLDGADLADSAVSAGVPGPAHRKVVTYENTSLYGGQGDQAGCDSPTQGGFTHGHLVAAVALGNPSFPGQTFRATDQNGNQWDLVGVAPGAKLAFYDAQITPAVGSCGDPVLGALNPGDLFTGAGTGALENGYTDHGARTFNLSWGNNNNLYGTVATDIDSFLLTNRDAMVFVPVGNVGRDTTNDGVPEAGSVIDTANAKNAVIVGGHGALDDYNVPQNRSERFQAVQAGSGIGPAGAQGRIVPLVMAPAQERALATAGGTGVDSESACTTGDNDQGAPVVCDQVTNKAGTSFASAAAAGAGMLIRDYFAQGFYPDGTASNAGNATDQVSNVSGALVKALLVASTDFLGHSFNGTNGSGAFGPDSLSLRYRFNREQGYGRIQLDNVLPLEGWSASGSGLVVSDLGISGGGVGDFPGLTPIDAVTGATQGTTLEVCDDTQQLRIALAWLDDVGDGLLNNLNLEVIAPSGRTYYGNYFTDDVNKNGSVDAITENCPTAFSDGTNTDGGFDRSRFSLPICLRQDATLPPFDAQNPTEAVFLSPNPQGDTDENGLPLLRGGQCSVSGDACGYDAHCPGGEVCTGGTAQVEAGTWTINVIAAAGGTNAAQRYALVASGGVCLGSSARFDATSYVCNDEAKITINERSEAADPAGGLSIAEIASRTTLQVVDANDVVRDTEAGTVLTFTQPEANVLQFVAENVPITDGTAYDPGNGVLDVQSGDHVVVVYADKTSGAADPDKVRTASSDVACNVNFLTGSVVFGQFRRDETFFVTGGCERNARGLFEFGFPDRYMDAGERLAYRFGFGSIEDADLENVELELRCVLADADSPATCKPGSTACADPNRTNNAACTQLTILDPIKVIGTLRANAAIAANFSIVMADSIAGTPEVDMVLAMRAQSAGKTVSTLAFNRHRLNVDEASKFYSTDFPKGGTEIQDRDNNGLLQNPTTTGLAGSPLSNDTDYKFETRVFSDLTIGTDASGNQVLVNTGINAPWNFDNNNGAFTSGINAESDDALIASTIAQWGEDKNFNNKLDGKCSASPSRPCDRFAEDPFNCGILCPECNFVFTCIGLEDRDPVNLPIPLLDQNWSTQGGCGWQTKAPGTCSLNGTIGCYSNSDCGAAAPCNFAAPQATGGVWHTGTVRNLSAVDCSFAGTSPGQCQLYETLAGTAGQLIWNELLATPVLTKVNQQLDAGGRPLAQAEVVDFKWNQSIGLGDNNVLWWWELDTDRDRLEPVDLYSDLVVLNSLRGAAGAGYGAANPGSNSFLTRGYSVFAPINPGTRLSQNGTVGNNRVGRNGCYFEGAAVAAIQLSQLGLASPPDDDAPEGYCAGDGGSTAPTSNNGITGETWYAAQDGHINYCSTVCSDNTGVLCASDAKCSGTCINPGLTGFCSNAPDQSGCTSNADCNFGTCVDIVCNGTCSGGTCTNNGAACGSDADCTEACVFTQGQASIDQYVFPNGPARNFELGDVNGTEQRFNTLEDIYGDTGNRFQGAIGFQNEQARTTPEAKTGFGLAVDDVVIEWREFTLDEDTTNCAVAGSCATVNIQQNNVYEGNTVLRIIVTDSSPSANDCDWDLVEDVPATRDCNNNGIDDVAIQVLWLENPDSTGFEVVIADSVGRDAYEGSITVSSSYDVAGTLFIATSGQNNPTVRARYFDRDDGTGNLCQNSVDEGAWGLVNHNVTVFLTPANLVVTRALFQDNIDNDGWADNSETVNMRVEVANKTANAVSGVSLRLSTNDPKIECITRPFLDFGDLAAGEARFSDEAFQFIMSNARRVDAFEDFSAAVTVSMDANEFQSPFVPQTFSFDVDLDAAGGTGPTQFFEGFEGGFGQFTTMHLDETLNPPPGDILNHSLGVLAADGWRCQYSDPQWQASASFNNSQGLVCYPSQDGVPDTYYWHIASERAFAGDQSLHYGVFLDPAALYSTPRANLEAIRLLEPINLGWANVCSVSRTTFCSTSGDCPGGEICEGSAPLFTFKHQISMIDGRAINSGPNLTRQMSADRGMVGAQLASAVGGDPIGDWIRLEPFVNLYDTQANTNYFNCTFDPADDGTTEGDFFDPSDPLRSLGPSSMCNPNFNFAFQGSTAGADTTRLGKASDGPGFLGGKGPGIWVEPAFDLSRFRGRRLRLRYVTSGLKAGSSPLWHPGFVNNTAINPDVRDDGWFIDAVNVTDTLTDPATVSIEATTNPDAVCGDPCTVATAVLAVDPTTSAAPGQVVSLDLSGSSLDTCTGGVPQFQFWIDSDRDGGIDQLSDLLVRDWTQNPELLDTPFGDTQYLAAVRCATDATCLSVAGATVAVNCPGGDTLGTGSATLPFLGREPLNRRPILFLNKSTIVWASTATVDFARGSLGTLRNGGDFSGTVCLADDVPDSSSLIDATNPAPGEGFYYLGRSASACNLQAGGSYDSAARDAGIASCPE